MQKNLAITHWVYNASAYYLKIFYNNGSADLYYSVSRFMYETLLRCSDKLAFIQRYFEYSLHFTRVSMISYI